MSKYDDYILHIIGSDLDALMHYGVPGQRKGHHDPRRRWQKQAVYADGRDDPNAVPKLKAPMNPKYFVNPKTFRNNWAYNQMVWTDLDNQEHGNWNRPMIQRATVSSNKPRKPKPNSPTNLSLRQQRNTDSAIARSGGSNRPAFNMPSSSNRRGNPNQSVYRTYNRNPDDTYTQTTYYTTPDGAGHAETESMSEEEAQRRLSNIRRFGGQNPNSMQTDADLGAKTAVDFVDRSQYSSEEEYQAARRQARLADYITDNNALKRKYGKDKAGYERELANLKDQYRDIRKLIKQYKNL